MDETNPEFEYCQCPGLHVLEQGPCNPEADIVAVHGLAANSVYTWIKKVPDADIRNDSDRVGRLNKKGLREVMWLKHLLPAEVPNARILKYNYASTYLANAAKESLRSIAERLVRLLHEFRLKEQDGIKRPLIFVGHSFGGVVIEEALVYAYKNQDYKHITLSACGVVFLGTPHRGSKASSWGVIIANTAAVLGLGAHNKLLKTLEEDSELLEQLLEDFSVLARELHMKLICFYETMPTKLGMFGVFTTTLVVDKRSATIDCYSPRSLPSDHSDMNKFGSAAEENFKLVSAAIRELAVWSRQIQRTDNRLEIDSLLQQLPPPTELFTGRENHLQMMRQHLMPENEGNQERRIFVLYGLAGSGKTQLALKFAELHENWFWKVFFVDASSAGVLEHQLACIAKHFKAGETQTHSLEWLAAQQRNWLLIFDNADDVDLSLEQYFPKGSHGNIVITTRNKDCIVHAPQSSLRMTPLSADDAAYLLLKASAVSLPCSDVTLQLAKSLTGDLGYLPLAVTQAGTFMRQNSTIEEYIDLFKKRRKHLLQNLSCHVQNANGHDLPVYTTWDLSYQRLDDSAKDFLKICAALHNEKIPKTLFSKGIPRLLGLGDDGPVAKQDAWEHIFRTHWISDCEWDVLKFNRTITQLTSYSLITVSENASLYSLHELVHCWIRDRLEAQSLKGIYKIVGKLIFLSMEHGSSLSDYKSRLQILPHAVQFPMSEWQEMRPDDMLLVGEMFYENGKDSKAEYLLKNALQKLTDVAAAATDGEDHLVILKCMDSLAKTYHVQEKIAEAEKLNLKLLETRQKRLGREHPDTLTSMNNLARVYGDQMKYAEAEKLHLEVTELYKRIHGKKHCDTLASMRNLASGYRQQQRLIEAEELYTEVLEISKEALGKEHPGTLESMTELSAIYRYQGRLVEAEKLCLEALEIFNKTVGRENLNTLSAIFQLTKIYTSQGRLDEAEKLALDGLVVSREILDTEHPETLGRMNTIANIYYKQGRLSEAETLDVEVLEVRKRILGKEHLDTLASMDSLARVYHQQGRFSESEKLRLERVEICTRIFGKEHSETLESMESLIRVYIDQKRLAEAEKLNIELLETRKRKLGLEHPDTISSRDSLARVYIDQERLAEAEKLNTEPPFGKRRKRMPQRVSRQNRARSSRTFCI